MNIIETKNLYLRIPSLSDASVLLSLFNQEDCIKYIGDKNLKSIKDTKLFIEEKFLAMYREQGFCLFVIELKSSSVAVGICGLVKRDGLDGIDIGFALLSGYQKQGIITEAALATKDYACNSLKLKRLLGITDVNNLASIAVLEKIGLRFDRHIKLRENTPHINLFSVDF